MLNNNPGNKIGALVISLDFELMWGIIDIPNAREYGETNVKNVGSVVTSMLALFKKYNVKATFATVGMLMCKDKEEILNFQPTLKPTYNNHKLSPYGDYINTIPFSNDPLYYASEIVDEIKLSDNAEIGTHTFCHYYCWEEGQTIEQFEEDLKTAIAVAEKKNIAIKSIVFPRNHVNPDYLRVCHKYGITSYRGNARSFFNKTSKKWESYYNRFCRIIDTYLPLTNNTTYNIFENLEERTVPLNIPASRLFRSYNKKFSFLEPLKIKRIKREMRYAAEHGELYHLWWHPHNFGANLKENMNNLESVLQYYKECHNKYGMVSYSMSELANSINKKRNNI